MAHAQRDRLRGPLILAFMIIGAALMAALGRVLFGPLQAMSSRYGTPALAFWADLVVLCFMRAQLAAGPVAKALPRGGGALGVFLACSLALHQLGYVNLVHRISAERLSGAMAYMVGVRSQPALSLYPVADPLAKGALDKRFETLALQHKSIFAEGWPEHLGSPLRAWTGESQGHCSGVVDNRANVPGGAVVQQLEGWAWLTDKRRAPDLIAFTDNRGTIVGFAEPGFMRKPLKKSLHSRRAMFAGFVGFAPGGPQTPYQAFGITLSHGMARACAFAVSRG